MRYFLLGFVLVAVLVVAVAGKRGDISRKPPLEFFDDMDRQLKLRPQADAGFFDDNRSSRLPVAGTVARGAHYENTPVNTGLIPGTTNGVEIIPIPVTRKLMERGRERYQISCLPCHGALADGNGITKIYGMAVVANLHDARIVKQPDGEIFNTITHGRGLMGAYGANIVPEDRWAIIAYLRALLRGHLASVDDVPAEMQSTFKK
jgi:mono/diheme cytochrome c family protein